MTLIRAPMNVGHAARAANGRTKWIAVWKAAWVEADQAAAAAEKRALGPAECRHQWSLKFSAAKDFPPPLPDNVEWYDQFIPAWNAAWAAAWTAALDAAKISLSERDKTGLSGVKKWNKAERQERAAAGLTAGCTAWNEKYRAEIQKLPPQGELG